jgi:hypothetical protein
MDDAMPDASLHHQVDDGGWMTTVDVRNRPSWLVTRTVALLAVVAMATGAGLVATTTAAYAACKGASCHGEWASTHGCSPGYERKIIFPIPGASLSVRSNAGDCGASPHWARLIWDGDSHNPPRRFNFKVERQQEYAGYGWLVTHSQSRTTTGTVNTFHTKMVATNTFNGRYRACVRYSHQLFDGWSPWSGWECTAFHHD